MYTLRCRHGNGLPSRDTLFIDVIKTLPFDWLRVGVHARRFERGGLLAGGSLASDCVADTIYGMLYPAMSAACFGHLLSSRSIQGPSVAHSLACSYGSTGKSSLSFNRLLHNVRIRYGCIGRSALFRSGLSFPITIPA